MADGSLEVKIIRVKRKTVGMKLTGPDCLTLRVPLKMSETDVDAVIEKNSTWIRRSRQRLLKEQEALQIQKKSLFYLGKTWAVSVRKADRRAVEFVGEGIRIDYVKKSQVEDLAVGFYKERAKEYMGERLEELSRKMGIAFVSMSVRNQKTRWGSCSAGGRLSFNCRLMMAPPEIIDYVLIHELCHLRHMNHSKAFWEEVSRWDPYYEEKRAWLKAEGRLLCFDGMTGML